MKLAARILDWVYPMNANCICCGDPSGAVRDGFCETCLNALEGARVCTDADCCPRCMAPLHGAETCGGCGLMAGRISKSTYAFFYRDAAAQAVRRFKYSGLGVLAETMAEEMLHAPRAAELLAHCDVIACAPMDRIRRSRRGYNQAWLLARALSEKTGIPARELLQRRPGAKPQARLNREERMRNLSGRIRCGEKLNGARVLLADDVRTTDATASACAEALLQAGASQVNLITFAASDFEPNFIP